MWDQLYCNLLIAQIGNAVHNLQQIARDERIGPYDRANISEHVNKINDHSIFLMDALHQMIAHQKMNKEK
jgi:hypothetical protein